MRDDGLIHNSIDLSNYYTKSQVDALIKQPQIINNSSSSIDINNRYDENMLTKMTLAPENIMYTFEAIKNLFNLGYKFVHANCVYEDVWNKKRDPLIFYKQLKELADYILDNDLYEKIGCSLFDEGHFHEYAENDDKNYCGSSCCMLAINNDGYIYFARS